MIRSFATTITFQQTVTTLSLHNQISTLTTTSLQHLKSLLSSKKYFLSLNVKFYQKPVSLINKLQPLSYQSKSSTTPRLPLHTSQPAPKIYKTLLHYYARLVERRPNICSHSVLFYLLLFCLFWYWNLHADDKVNKVIYFLVFKRQISASRFFDLLGCYTRVFSKSALSFSASLHVLHPNNQKQITLTFCFKTNFKLRFVYLISTHYIWLDYHDYGTQ